MGYDRIVVTGGGTGGHLYPALAVCESLKEQPWVEKLLYIGNIGKKESLLIPEHGIAFEGLVFSGMPRGIDFRLFPWFATLLSSFLKARHILKQFAPQVVFGTGGYVTAPVLLAAKSLGIPFVIHEPDAHPGMVNRKMAPWATAVTCAFEEARTRLKTKALFVTGNPLRNAIGNISKAEALERLNPGFSLERPILLITGGSQGARKINQAVLEALPGIIGELNLQIIHQTGESLYEEVLMACPEAYRHHSGYWVRPFIQDMASVLALADLAVCRSGSMTLSEMYRAEIPMILVPYPYAAADHQRKNAIASQRAGASVMIEDADLSGPTLLHQVKTLLHEKGVLQGMKRVAHDLASPRATETIVDLLHHVGEGHRTLSAFQKQAWIHSKTGAIQLDNVLSVIQPSMTLNAFLQSDLASSAELQMSHGAHDEHQAYVLRPTIQEYPFSIRLYFKEGVLQSLSLRCTRSDFGISREDGSEEKEMACLQFHDQLLSQSLGKQRRFSWGEVDSSYDPRSSGSSITIQYKLSKKSS